ncbi:MAG: IPTL-CTERM sorting domain-containing protein [Phycisphaerae bacterium]
MISTRSLTLLRTWVSLLVPTAVGSSATVLADPIVPACTVEEYATGIDRPIRMSFDPLSGFLYVGRNSSNPTVKIWRVNKDRTFREYGDAPVHDPDTAVFVDGDFCVNIEGTPTNLNGAVLTGGHYDSTQGIIEAIMPDESVITVFGPTDAWEDPTDLVFDNNLRLLFGDHGDGPDSHLVFARAKECDAGDPVQFFPTARADFIAVDSQNRIWTLDIDGVIKVHDENGTPLDNCFAQGFSGHIYIRIGPGGPWVNDLYVANTNGELWRYVAPEPNMDVCPTKAEPDEIVGTNFPTEYDIEFGPDQALYVSIEAENRILRIFPDCNDNGIPDECDIGCGPTGGLCDVNGCGESNDCNENGIPDECDLEDGTLHDDNSDGVPDECGACCGSFGDVGCSQWSPDLCEDNGGVYLGDGTVCEGDACPIPTVSEWGLMVMALLVLTAGTLVYTRRRSAQM